MKNLNESASKYKLDRQLYMYIYIYIYIYYREPFVFYINILFCS